ncbi:MAG: sugar transferase [Clostridia bacterium]|nr:sugar transferase [Clostridia bacterium]
MYRFFKRFFDIVLSLIALPFVLLVIVVMAPFIYFADKGPVFYNANRVGKNGKIFKMFKLRSMKVNAPDIRNADGSTYNGANDPRVTKVGRFMRKTSIDEFPQFLNVLKGDMSLIGPRPTLATKSYDELTDDQKKRYFVRPGITGYSQAYYRNSATADQKLEHDIYYVENISLWLDVKILFKTIFSVLKRENIYVTAQEIKPETVTETKESVEA